MILLTSSHHLDGLPSSWPLKFTSLHNAITFLCPQPSSAPVDCQAQRPWIALSGHEAQSTVTRTHTTN